jgi:hypothetical protein
MEVKLYAFLTSETNGGKRSVSSFQKVPRYPKDMKLTWPKSRSGSGGEEKNTFPCKDMNHGRPTSG